MFKPSKAKNNRHKLEFEKCVTHAQREMGEEESCGENRRKFPQMTHAPRRTQTEDGKESNNAIVPS
uniref:HDC10259 n=1 Tax=Drosophila melanogaster TaxID=7227 RepID=Q6IL65_DROME|nr:TPA_inf: HDC10259 [Drosophila melanogaster]